MIPCPIAHWKQQRPDAFAIDSMTYREFDALIQKLSGSLSTIKEEIIAFIPKNTPIDLAIFFAAWRMGKAVYPLNPRLPHQAIQKRLQETSAHLFMKNLSSPIAIDSFNGNSIATLIETSSASKIACHRLDSHFIAANAALQALSITPNSSYRLNLPLFHIAGIALALRTFIAGACILLPTSKQPETHLSLVPTQLFRLLEAPFSMPKLKCLLIGGAPLSKTLRDKALQQKLPLYSTYGMTEASSMVALQPPGKPTAILPHIQCKLSDENEILLQGPSLLNNYWGQEPQKGWFATKDIGKIQNGELEILGRKDRQFISGGENIHPEEIERQLLQLPHVIEAQVHPEEDLEFGMRPVARLYCSETFPQDEIQKQLEKHLPRFKVPKEIHVSTTPLANSKLMKLGQN